MLCVAALTEFPVIWKAWNWMPDSPSNRRSARTGRVVGSPSRR
jgi:hypothetical protein